MRIPKFKSVLALIKANPQPAADYRTYDTRTMSGWGNSVFWMGEKVCIFGPTPKPGDVVLSDSVSGLGLAFVITDVHTPRDPGDQHFVNVVKWGRPDDLPERIESAGSDWIT